MDNKKQSLYTKYRPKTFDQVVGQSVAKEILTNSIRRDMINHAYLFYGIRGTGKTTLARIFAKAINCENSNDHNPCNTCSVCESINNGSAFDVIEIDAASNNGVDEIRTIKENTTFLTTTSKYKVYIIDEVHMLSKAAFNALLKTLEEPPRNTIFLLATTELHKIPQTVLSRTVVINLEVMSDKDIREGLEVVLKGEEVNYEDNALDYIIMTSGGSLRDAISALETTLLYNSELSTDNAISALGLINKEVLSDMIKNNVGKLIESIDDSDKDPKKLSLLILEVIMHLIKNGETKYIKVLNSLITAVNSIKDPLLLRIAMKTAFYSVNVPRETLLETHEVPRETQTKTIVVEGPIVENVENEYTVTPKAQDNNKINDNNVVENKVENLVENPQPVVEKSLETQIIDNPPSEEVKIDNKPIEMPINNQNTNVEAISTPKPVVNNNLPPRPPKKNENELKIVTDYADLGTYMYVIKNNNKEIFEKISNRWKFKDSYVTRMEFKNIITALMATQPLAATNKTIIVGFKDENIISEYKRISLTPTYFDFIKEFLGDYKFILPVNNETWTKLLASKDSYQLDPQQTDIKPEAKDFLASRTEEVILKATSLFGEGNLTHE